MRKIASLFNKSFASLFIMGLRVLIMAAKLGLSIFLARFMGLEVLGLYGLLASAVSVVPVFFKAGMHNILMRDAVTQSPEALARNLFHYYTAVFGAYALVFPLVAYGASISGYGYLPLLVFLLIVLEHVVTDWFFLLVSLKRAVRANVFLFVQAGGWMLPFMAGAWYFPELRNVPVLLIFWAGGGILAILTTLSVWSNFSWRAVFSQGLDKSWYLDHWKKSRLFYIGDLANAGGIHIDRYLISFVLGLELAGVYVLFWQMANAVYTLVFTGVLQLYRPKLIETYAQESFENFRKLYKKSLVGIALSAIALSFTAAIIAPFVIQWTDRPLALSLIPVLWVMLCAMFLRALSDGAGNALLARYMDKTLIFSNLMQLVGAFLFIYFGLQLVGIYGAATGLLLTYALLFAYRQYASDKPKVEG